MHNVIKMEIWLAENQVKTKPKDQEKKNER